MSTPESLNFPSDSGRELGENQIRQLNTLRANLAGLFRPDVFGYIHQATDIGEEYSVYSLGKIRSLSVIYKSPAFWKEEMLVKSLEENLKSKLFERKGVSRFSLEEGFEIALQAGFLARRIMTVCESREPFPYYKINLELEGDYFTLTRYNPGEARLFMRVEEIAKDQPVEYMNQDQYAIVISLMEGMLCTLGFRKEES